MGSLLFAQVHFHAFRDSIDLFPSFLFPSITDGLFPSSLFPSITNDTHIIGDASIVFQVFHHFSSHLDLIGLAI